MSQHPQIGDPEMCAAEYHEVTLNQATFQLAPVSKHSTWGQGALAIS